MAPTVMLLMLWLKAIWSGARARRNPVSTRDSRIFLKTLSSFLPPATFFAKALDKESPNLSESPMRVLSWRSLSFSQSDLGLLVPGFWSSPAIKTVLYIFLFPLLGLTACNTKPAPDLVFNSEDLSKKEFSRAEAECNLEAEKAAMLASNSVTAGERWRKILILCMEAKGTRFVGTADQVPPDAKPQRTIQ
ncbi:hypothetical protein [Microvirga sp. P5_D2]